jgi:hypothetical protein
MWEKISNTVINIYFKRRLIQGRLLIFNSEYFAFLFLHKYIIEIKIYKNIILLIAYGYKTSSCALRKNSDQGHLRRKC